MFGSLIGCSLGSSGMQYQSKDEPNIGSSQSYPFSCRPATRRGGFDPLVLYYRLLLLHGSWSFDSMTVLILLHRSLFPMMCSHQLHSPLTLVQGVWGQHVFSCCVSDSLMVHVVHCNQGWLHRTTCRPLVALECDPLTVTCSCSLSFRYFDPISLNLTFSPLTLTLTVVLIFWPLFCGPLNF